MIAQRSKIVFAIGFTFGMVVIGSLNYLTFLHPRWYPSADGSLSMHGPTVSGFPLDMYMDGYTFDMFLADGLVGNVVVGLAVSVVFGWIATKIPSPKTPLK